MLNFSIEKRHVYLLPVYFAENNQWKERPVIVLAIKDEQVALISTTATVPEIHSRFIQSIHYKRLAILNWRKNPFVSPSWVRMEYIYTINKTDLERELSSEKYLGKMTVEDFNIIITSIKKRNLVFKKFRQE